MSSPSKLKKPRLEGRNNITASGQANQPNDRVYIKRGRHKKSDPSRCPDSVPDPPVLSAPLVVHDYDRVVEYVFRAQEGLSTQESDPSRGQDCVPDAPVFNAPLVNDHDREAEYVLRAHEGLSTQEEHIQEEGGEGVVETIPALVEAEDHATDEGENDNVAGDKHAPTLRGSTHGKKKGGARRGKKKVGLCRPQLKKGVDGGPESPELLISFEGHVADDIRINKERDPITLHQRTGQLGSWTLSDADWCDIVRRSNLSHIHNQPLICAFVER